MKKIERSVLYHIVWSKPMIHAGPELGVSGTGLKKICQRHEIPIPPQGWWAKLAAGYKLTRPSLPIATAPSLERVTIGSRRYLAEGGTGPVTPRVNCSTIVPEAKPLALPAWIERTEAALRARRPDEQGIVRLKRKSAPRVSISADSIDRLTRFLSGFDVAIGEQGWKLESSDEGLCVLVGLEPVAFAIEDRLSRKLHQPTAAEMAEQARRKRLGYSFLSDTPWPKYDHAASGEMAFIVQGSVNDGLRRKWGDTSRRRLEHALPSIIESFAEHAAAQITEREHWAERKRRWDEQAARRRLEEEERRLNQTRLKVAEDVDGVLGQIAMLGRVIDHISGLVDIPDELAAYQSWCDHQQQELHGQVSGRGLVNRMIRAGVLKSTL
ncbi:hypothetical protein [Maricaulis sp.]|uniref:hypothetical protein n=1 Tax=Maricaulis sp. TaxID=1486257 RepID=UPI003A90464D